MNWTSQNVEQALERIGRDQDFHARQREHEQKAQARYDKGRARRKASGKKVSTPRELPPDALCLAIHRATGYMPLRERRFHPVRGWKFDYLIEELKIAIEQEGGVWREGGGAHSSPKAILRDMSKYSEAAILGYIVLRLTPEELVTYGELPEKLCQWLNLAIELQNNRKFLNCL